MILVDTKIYFSLFELSITMLNISYYISVGRNYQANILKRRKCIKI